ncbi:ABC transporter ATP-binding protein [Anaerotalea alkaliphila]|uniref:ATP-binding cassette domain-containing protein n=1 Tax=Anaerotalea alkaliphila TaxID=2662126 RepID=A0A7X5KNZ9_9FIRM|nr:ATP-binding cassette domain-containing protein [Anaerotalea alkaliphila]NDL67292.1 ATP-binding cassette domain-containing protein [Anaerotalea alkaliphila]
MIRVEHLWKRFGELSLYEDFSLDIPEGRVLAILGPSGCGKTTLLNMICGLEAPDRGRVTGVEGKGFSYVFQETRLLPWATVLENMTFVLKGPFGKEKARERAMETLEMVRLEEFAGYKPSQLSGGMRQRLSLARAFAYPAEILVMDEPFKGQDRGLKEELLGHFKNLLARDPRTVLFVTHDPEEADLVADARILLEGRPVRMMQGDGSSASSTQRNDELE